MTDLEYYDDDFYEDDFTDEEDGRGSSKGLNMSKSSQQLQKPPNKPVKAFTSRNSRSSLRVSRNEKRITKRNEERLNSSKRRQNLNVRNHLAELTINYEELSKENKLLKQIQKRQERELDRYTNADEDLPRLLDANSHEIAGLKAKNKQLLFEKRELDDKLRREHQEIMTLKDQNKKLTTLTNNKKLGEREKLELDITTAKVTIAHQESKIQDLTKAVEIYKKTAEREVKSNQLHTRKAQNNLRELQDAYNELFIKFKAREKELGNQNIYTQFSQQQRGRENSKRAMKSGPSQTSLSESINTPKTSTSAAEPSPGNPTKTSRRMLPNRANPSRTESSHTEQTPGRQSKQLSRLESELEELNKQSTSLADLERALADDTDEIYQSDDDIDREPVLEERSPRRQSSPRTRNLSNDVPAKKSVTEADPPVRDTDLLMQAAESERIRRENEVEEKRREDEKRKEEEHRIEEEQKRREKERKLEERRKAEEAAEKERQKAEAEKIAAKEEEARLLQEKKQKDEELKNRLASVRNQSGGDDFMSQLKAKRNTPSISPVNKATPAAAVDVQSPVSNRNSKSTESLRKVGLPYASNKSLNSIKDEIDTGYQPSFVSQETHNSKVSSAGSGDSIGGSYNKRLSAGKADPFGVVLDTNTSEYTPTFSTNQRINGANRDTRGWAPTGRASTSQRNGLFDTTLENKPLRRRQSKPKNVLPNNYSSYDTEDDLEELVL